MVPTPKRKKGREREPTARWPVLLDLKTASEYLSVAPRTLPEWIDEGLAPFSWARLLLRNGKVARKRFLHRADLDGWAEMARRLAQDPERAIVEEIVRQCMR